MKNFSDKNEIVIPYGIASLMLRHFCGKRILICFSDFERYTGEKIHLTKSRLYTIICSILHNRKEGYVWHKRI